MKLQFPTFLKDNILSFAKLYHRYRIQADRLTSVRYQIVSSLDEYKRTNKVELSITDKPGDILPAMTISEIKKSGDIILGMHPVDVNTINDLYYLSKDKILEIKVFGDKIIATTQEGLITEYNINQRINVDKIVSTRVSYMLGQMQAEKLMRETYKENIRYKILKDNIATLHVEDDKTKKQILKKPNDILFSGEYKFYSKEDVARISYICGQMSQVN